VESLTGVFDDVPVRATGHPGDHLNRYSPASIANELVWAFDPAAAFPAEALQQLPDGTWLDPHATHMLEFADREETLRRRDLVTELMRRTAACRVVVITLGLIEVFYDTWTDLYANVPPWLTADPGRFLFRLLSFEESIASLERVHALLTANGHPGVQVVVTTSPVPLEETFTGLDVAVANARSKAVLRAVASEWADAHDNVHYFPSYEIVTSSPREAAWYMDGRHVRDEMVEHIVRLFRETYCGPQTGEAPHRTPEPSRERAASRAR
jgi:hypothetical protein